MMIFSYIFLFASTYFILNVAMLCTTTFSRSSSVCMCCFYVCISCAARSVGMSVPRRCGADPTTDPPSVPAEDWCGMARERADTWKTHFWTFGSGTYARLPRDHFLGFKHFFSFLFEMCSWSEYSISSCFGGIYHDLTALFRIRWGMMVFRIRFPHCTPN